MLDVDLMEDKTLEFATPAVKDAIEKTVKDQFPDAIDSVRIVPDLDSDGDEIFRVTVVLKKNRALDPIKMIGLVRHIRANIDVEAFPLVSFVSKQDAKRLRIEAA